MKMGKIAAFILFVTLVQVFFNVADMLYATYVVRGAYRLAIGPVQGLPLIVAMTVGYFLFLRGGDPEADDD